MTVQNKKKLSLGDSKWRLKARFVVLKGRFFDVKVT
jgi:hypothetical protein